MNPRDPSSADATPSRSLLLAAGLVLLAQGLGLFAPMAVLGGAIQWPDSLDYPPSRMLPLLREQLDAVRLGYGLYLGYSLLFLVTGVLTVRLASRPGPLGALALIAIGAAAASALARAIGILRWLTVMPVLAQAHASAEPASRAGIELVFDAITTWGGGIGEILGVSLFMAVAMAVLVVGGWRTRAWPRPLAALGGLAALALALLSLPVAGGPDLMPVAVAVSLLSAWMLATGVVLMLRRP
jgi:hypothetical protein